MSGVGTLKSPSLKLQIACKRCESRTDVEAAARLSVTKQCATCRTDQRVTFHPVLAHAFSAIVGSLDLQACRAVDLLPSPFVVSCLECMEDQQCPDFQPGSSKWSTNCRECHHAISVRAARVVFATREEFKAMPKTNPGTSSRGGGGGSSSAQTMRGQPLPRQGTCSHYKQSHRWLRFPCCGKAFPCESCHDLVNDHPAEWAKRMICGYCGTEQTYTGTKPCAFCNKRLTGGSGSKAHWEGGHGARNAQKLSHKDNKKHAGMNKTVSRKAAARAEKKK